MSKLTRSEFLKVMGLGASSLTLPGCAHLLRGTRGKGAGKRPNIIFIESDSMDGRIMGCAGHPAAYTPNMDRLAGRGALFLNTYCNSPQCCPSRASMWSGQHTHQIEGWNNYKGIEKGTPTFRTHLDQASYLTHTTGKTDYLSGGHSLTNRVCHWTRTANIRLPQKPRPDAKVSDSNEHRFRSGDWDRIDKCKEWLRQNAGQDGRPFMLYCGLSIPHPAFRTSKKWLETIDPEKVTLPPYEAQLHPVMEYMAATKNSLGEFSDEEILAIRRTYYAMIAEADAMVGELVDTVESMGLGDSTYIIYTSDHGEMNMEHRQWLKNSLYEASVRVPMIIAGPGVKEGLVVDDLVSLIDIFPTLMDMAGLPHPEGLAGHSLMPLMQGRPGERPDWVLSQYHANFANTGTFLLRRGDWKYIVYAGYEPRLFNLKEDPDEMVNLVPSRPDVVQAMDARLLEIVDYDAVDAKVKAYDRESFTRWRAEVGAEECSRIMKEVVYKGFGWSVEHDRQLASWLGEK